MVKIAFIVNPVAGGKSKEQFVSCIPHYFSRAEGYDAEILYTQQSGDAHQFAANLVQQGFTKIVAVGGDGSVNETASALRNTDAALGIVPFGSGNGLARHIGIPLNPVKALLYLKQASVCRIDSCEINGTPFFCTAGVGFDALIGAEFARSGQRGVAAYLKLIAQKITTYHPETYRITINGKEIERTAFLVTFANASQWGNNGWIAPHADLADGLIDVMIVNSFALYKLPILSARLLTKRIEGTGEVEHFKCSSVKLERQNGGYIHFDGEPTVMGKQLDVKNLGNSLNLLC